MKITMIFEVYFKRKLLIEKQEISCEAHVSVTYKPWSFHQLHKNQRKAASNNWIIIFLQNHALEVIKI